jgi:isocitrate/isopropylmalate dehydrogenase
MKTYKIGIIARDGTGPEVTAEAVKVMDVVCSNSASR